MADLYEIDSKIKELIDYDTGEVSDPAMFIMLNMEKDEKIHNMALGFKNLTAEAKAISEEIVKLEKRKKTAENKARTLKEYIDFFSEKESRKYPNAEISYRKNHHVEVDSGFIEWAKINNPELLIQKDPEESKSKIKEYLNQGNKLEYARIVETNDIQIR